MTPAKDPTGRDFLDFQVDVGNMKYQMDAMVKQGERQEKKLDALKQSMDALSIVSRHEFDDYKDAVNARFETFDNKFVKTESTKGIRAIALAVGIALATAIVLGLARLLGARI